jgi:hypothetical protein
MNRAEQSLPKDAYAKRLDAAAAAIAAFRRAHPGQPFPSKLREEVVAAVEAGVAVGVAAKACGLSTTQVRLWRSKAEGSPRASGSSPSARVLSVVDAPSERPGLVDEEVEIRVGAWRVHLSRWVG